MKKGSVINKSINQSINGDSSLGRSPSNLGDNDTKVVIKQASQPERC